jgi:hypothetical protein
MNKLVFNTTEKFVILYSDMSESEELLRIFDTPTVKVCPEGFYEVMVKHPKNGVNIPHLRVPINNTIMFIEQ